MAFNFDGTDQNAVNDQGITGIDITEITIAGWVNSTATPNGDAIVGVGTEITAGAFLQNILANSPASAPDWRIAYQRKFTTVSGAWYYTTDLSLNTWYHILIRYDRSNGISEVPSIYVNGSSVTATELVTPSGSIVTGDDSISFGENVGGGQDWAGQTAEFAIWTGDKTALAPALAAGYSPKFFLSGLLNYWDMLSNDRELIRGEELTRTGTTIVAHPRIIQPSSAQIAYITEAVAGGLSIPIAMHHYTKNTGGQ